MMASRMVMRDGTFKSGENSDVEDEENLIMMMMGLMIWKRSWNTHCICLKFIFNFITN